MQGLARIVLSRKRSLVEAPTITGRQERMGLQFKCLQSDADGRPRRGMRRLRAFTLIELLVVMTIGAIIMSIGVPSFKYVTTANRIAGEINGLLGDLQFARAEAIKDGRTVTVCSVTLAAPTTCSGTSTWSGGWMVFKDPNNNKTLDVGESILRQQRAFTSTDTLAANNAISAVSFNREGFALGMSFATTATLTLHDAASNAARTRCIAISAVGQLASQKSGTGACL